MKKKNHLMNIMAVVLMAMIGLVLKGCGGGGTSNVLAPTNNTAASTVTYTDTLPSAMEAKAAADITTFDTEAPTAFYDGTTIATSGATTQAITACNSCHARTQYVPFLNTRHYNNNVTCESCHGVSSLHTVGGGDKNKIIAAWQALSASTCANCHSSYYDEWEKSGHSTAKHAAHGSSGCTPCHTGEGFIEYAGWSKTNNNDDLMYFLGESGAKTVTGAETEGNGAHNVNCGACHSPHETGYAGQLRLDKSALCISCHEGRKKLPGDSRAPHHNLQGRVLLGQGIVNTSHEMLWDRAGFLCGSNEETSSAACGTSNTYTTISTTVNPIMGPATTCTDCHMYSSATAGKGHTFKPNSEKCKTCHTGMSPAAVISNIQSNYDALYNPMKARLDAAVAGLGMQIGSTGLVTNAADYTEAQLKAYYEASWNLNYIDYDGSKGVHNFTLVEKAMEYTDAMLTSLGY
jgi:predicted CXXCH cytochrome family protein